MERVIVGFHQDEFSDWIADLDCGHGRHMRHKPPWMVREWVLTEEGRRGFIGHTLDCKKCEPPQPQTPEPASPSHQDASNKG